MNDPQLRFEELVTALKSEDFRLTPQRLELLRLIVSDHGHPNAAELYAKINSKFPTMSQATVYKTLALLKEMGQILEIDLHGDSHYDGNHPQPHAHLICTNCHKIVDAELALDQDTIKKMEKTSGFSGLRPQITIYGFCPDCKESIKH